MHNAFGFQYTFLCGYCCSFYNTFDVLLIWLLCSLWAVEPLYLMF